MIPKCEKHGHLGCRECFPLFELKMPRQAPVCRTETVRLAVEVSVDQSEVDKLNRRAVALGRASRTAGQIIEVAVADALKHHWIVASASVKVNEIADVTPRPHDIEEVTGHGRN